MISLPLFLLKFYIKRKNFITITKHNEEWIPLARLNLGNFIFLGRVLYFGSNVGPFGPCSFSPFGPFCPCGPFLLPPWSILQIVFSQLGCVSFFLQLFCSTNLYVIFRLFPPPTSHKHEFYSLTSGFTRLIVKTKYVC